MDNIPIKDTIQETNTKEDDKICMACYTEIRENETISILKCGHNFHYECIFYTYKNNLENIIVIQDARMDEIFIGKYQLDNQKNLKTSTPIQLQSKFDKIIDNGPEIAVTGNASNSYLEALNGQFKIRPIKENIIYPNASFLLKLGKKYYSDDLSIKPEELVIDYIRNKVASKATK